MATKAKRSATAVKPADKSRKLELNPVQQTRLDNTRLLILYNDGPVNLSRKMGYKNGSFLVQIAGPNPGRGITEKQARKMELLLGLPDRILDSPVEHGRLKRALGIDADADVVNMGRFSLDKAMQRNRSARMRLGDLIARVMTALGKDATPDRVGRATQQVLEVSDLADREPDTVMVSKIADRHRDTGS